MHQPTLPEEAIRFLHQAAHADIVVGIPSYNNARTIGHVVRAAKAGLAKYFSNYTAVIINSDGGSTDSTKEQVLDADLHDPHLLFISMPLTAVNKLSMPYHGIPGKGSAFRGIFQMAVELKARACAVVDSDLRSITPEWIDLLLRPILHSNYDFVAPYYHRHKYDGTITNSIVYPLTRSLYGLRVRQPIGGEFGISGRLLARYLERDDWETDVARYGIDIWLTTIAIAEGFRVCQSFLGAKLHDAKDPGADLAAMLQQVVGSVFQLMPEYFDRWRAVNSSVPADLFGFRFDVGLEPVPVNVQRMIDRFCEGAENLRDIWSIALRPAQLRGWNQLSRYSAEKGPFHFSDELWVRTVHDFAIAYRNYPLERGHLMRSFTPLYLARVASFVLDTQQDDAAQVEAKIENLCLSFESYKPELLALWLGQEPPPAPDMKSDLHHQEVIQ